MFFQRENLLGSASISRGVRSEVGGGEVVLLAPLWRRHWPLSPPAGRGLIENDLKLFRTGFDNSLTAYFSSRFAGNPGDRWQCVSFLYSDGG